MDKKRKQYKWITIASAGCKNRTRASPIQPYHDNQLIRQSSCLILESYSFWPVLTRALVQTCFWVLFCATLGSVYMFSRMHVLKKIMDFWVRWWYYICQQPFFTKRQIYLPNHLSFETYPNGLISVQSGSQRVRPPVQFSLAQLHNAKISAFTRVNPMTKWLLHSPVNHRASSFLLTRHRLD